MPTNSVTVSNTTPTGALVDDQRRATFGMLKWMQSVGKLVNQGFDQAGNYQGPIGSQATIVGRRFLATIVQHLSDAGVIDSAGLPAASPTAQGAVKLAVGSVGNTLGSAAMESTASFDPSGSAAAAQANAEAFASSAAGTAQSNANTYTDSKVAAAFAPGISVTITTAALTGTGTQGSMTFTNGLLTAQVQAT